MCATLYLRTLSCSFCTRATLCLISRRWLITRFRHQNSAQRLTIIVELIAMIVRLIAAVSYLAMQRIPVQACVGVHEQFIPFILTAVQLDPRSM